MPELADAKGLLSTTAPIFAKLGTTDFEHVPLACWYAEHVNVALGTPSADISVAYAEVRTALIEAAHSVHPIHVVNLTTLAPDIVAAILDDA